MESQENNPTLSAGQVNQGETVDRSATGLQFQHMQLGLKATGAALGIGRRTVPDPRQQFSQPISGGQFGNGNAKSLYGEVD